MTRSALLLAALLISGCASVPGSLLNARAHLMGEPTPSQKRELAQRQAAQDKAASGRAADLARTAAAIKSQQFAQETAARKGLGIPVCDGTQMAAFVDHAQASYGTRPTTGCAYDLAGMVIAQQVPGGYFLADAIAEGHEIAGQQFAYLETKAWHRPADAIGGYAVFTGTRAYTAQDGFERTVFAFRAYP